MSIDVNSIFAAKLARNRGIHPLDPDWTQASDYGIAATIDGNLLAVALTFRTEVAYCCFEPGCHLALFTGKRWDGLRRELAASGIDVPRKLELHLTCVIEEGALSFDISRPDPLRRGRYAFQRSPKYQCEVQELEADC